MLIKNVDIFGVRQDIRLSGGIITEISTKISGDSDFDGQGRALIPGLHDHHIHLNASAAALNSVKCGPPEVNNAKELVAALHKPGKGWLRGIGYHHSVAGEIDRVWLDANGPDRPIRIQHRGGRMWIFNSAAMALLDLAEPADGRLVDGDHLIRTSSSFPDLKPLVNKLLSYGITGVTEVTPSNGVSELQHYVANARPLRLCVMGTSQLSSRSDSIIGPLKLHYHDHNLPALDDLSREVADAHAAGRAVAAHCVTRAELMLTLAAIEEAGAHPGDRIEHAAIADDAAIEWMKRLGVIVVTQPGFIAERSEAYLKDVSSDDHENLWRLAGFDRAGLAMAAGSDAPFGSMDPWKAMAAAVERPHGFGPNETVTPEAALALYTKPANDSGAPARKIAVGEVADLCLLDEPWKETRENLGNVRVLASWIAGELVYNRVD